MVDALVDAKNLLTPVVGSDLEPIQTDPWIVISLLQKSIRRGETELATRAALTLLQAKPSALWRRFIIIAFEDVGIGSPDAVAATVMACTDASLRKRQGGDSAVAVQLARALAEAPKDRSTDYLGAARDHPSLATAVGMFATATTAQRVAAVADQSLPLQQRCVAATMLCGVQAGRYWAWDRRASTALFSVFRKLGVPENLVDATETAAARTREPFIVLVPLIWLGAQRGEWARVIERPIPPLVVTDGIPLYALDMHTRLGRAAIGRFATQNDAVQACLDCYVPTSRWRDAAYNAAFYVDAAPVAKRLMWEGSEDIEAFGKARDLLVAGVAPEGQAELLAVLTEQLPHLNEIRAELLTGASAGRGTAAVQQATQR